MSARSPRETTVPLFPWGISAQGVRASRATTERIDPLSAAAARPVTWGILVLAVLLPMFSLLTRGDEVTSPVLLGVALLAILAAAVLLIDRTRPRRPVMSPTWAVGLYVLLAAAQLASFASMWGANAVLRDDWAPLVVGLILMALAPYRPAAELVIATVALTVVALSLAIVSAPLTDAMLPTGVLAVAGSTSLASLGCASAAYALSMNRSILDWLDHAWHAAAQSAAHQRGGVARSVQQRRVSLVNRQIVPYLSRISDAAELTLEDRQEAQELSQSIRTLLVADIERGWVHTLLEEVTASVPGAEPVVTADDPDDVGRALTTAQRTLLRAIAMVAVERLHATEIMLSLATGPSGVRVRWELGLPEGDTPPAQQLRAVLHLVRGLTSHSRVEPRAGGLALEFHYGH